MRNWEFFLGALAIGELKAGEEQEWILFLSDPSVAVWIGAGGAAGTPGRRHYGSPGGR